MTLRAMLLAAVLLAVATDVQARAPAPLVPIALVEDVKSATADIEFMDYVGSGQVITLAAGDTLVLSYLKSCEHETITGGTVTVGAQRSDVRGGKIVRAKVPCDGGKIRLTSEQASTSAASAFRLQSGEVRPRLYARTPVIQLPRILADGDRTLLVERVGKPGEQHTVKLDDSLAGGGFYDLAKSNVTLTRGAVYEARIGRSKVKFQIDAKAKSGPTPVVSRLVRFE
jgi:hypothetical protein